MPTKFFILVASFAASAAAWTPPVFTRLDSLFITAATGEPRYQALRDSSEKVLLADTGTLPYLLAQRMRGQTPRQQHYVERLFRVTSDSGRNPRPRTLLISALTEPGTSDTVRAQFLYIGSCLGDSAFRSAAIPWLKSKSEPVRRMATRNLGVYPRPANLPLLWDGLLTVRGLELQQRLWSLEAQGPIKDGKALPLLNDPYFFNRRKVRDMLLKATDSTWARLDSIRMKHRGIVNRQEWRLLAQDAKGGEAFLESEKSAMTAEERKYFGVD